MFKTLTPLTVLACVIAIPEFESNHQPISSPASLAHCRQPILLGRPQAQPDSFRPYRPDIAP